MTSLVTNQRWRSATNMKIVMSAYLSENKPIVIKFGTLFSTESIVTKNQILVFKMADGRHI